MRRPARRRCLRLWRHVAYFAGVAAVFLSLESPIDAMADHLFWMHQIQHMLLRMIGPMLIALAAPQAMLISGLPSAPTARCAGAVRRQRRAAPIFSILINAMVVTALFIAALYRLAIPALHNAAILNDGIHYTMHVTMLAAGLLFWWRIFDIAAAADGLRLRHAADDAVDRHARADRARRLHHAQERCALSSLRRDGRLFDINPLTDETIGGFIIWVPSTHDVPAGGDPRHPSLGRPGDPRRRKACSAWSPSNSAALRYPTTGAALIAQARPKNRRMAIGIVGFRRFRSSSS